MQGMKKGLARLNMSDRQNLSRTVNTGIAPSVSDLSASNAHKTLRNHVSSLLWENVSNACLGESVPDWRCIRMSTSDQSQRSWARCQRPSVAVSFRKGFGSLSVWTNGHCELANMYTHFLNKDVRMQSHCNACSSAVTSETFIRDGKNRLIRRKNHERSQMKKWSLSNRKDLERTRAGNKSNSGVKQRWWRGDGKKIGHSIS